MSQALIELILFTSKSVILFLLIFLTLIAFLSLLSKSKDKLKGMLSIKNLNQKYADNRETMLAETLSKKSFKKSLKDKKAATKKSQKKTPKNIYVLNFNGDIRASAVTSLREEVTAVLNVASTHDEVILRLESAGGVVHGYGLAAAQLMRIRAKNIPLTITIDKIAASGGYMMASVANRILSAPFAIIGSIGVIVQLPNFHRVLKDKHVDFEQLTAGDYKRTITMFGENTEEGREKLQQEIEDIHQLFKNLITEHRPDINIKKVATGEHWMGLQALSLNLVDEIKTSDEYLLERSHDATLYEICFEIKKPLFSKFAASAQLLKDKLLGRFGVSV